jgi:hypothetical protein
MHDSHLPGWKWLVGVELMMGAPEGFPAQRLWQLFGGSYKSAWFLEHRIRAALPDPGPASPNVQPGHAHHRTSSKYRGAYLAEASWRSTPADGAAHFRATILNLLDAEPMNYRELIS